MNAARRGISGLTRLACALALPGMIAVACGGSHDTAPTASAGPTPLASVSTSGLVTGVAAGGPVTVTATSEGKNGTALVTAMVSMVTGIGNPATFMSHCPTTDPAYATLRQDFELRFDGPIDSVAVTCTEPYTAMPIAQLTDDGTGSRPSSSSTPMKRDMRSPAAIRT